MQKMQNLFNNRKVFYSVIIVLTLLFGVFSFLTIKSYSNKEEPKAKEKVLERETFTTYISDGNGGFKVDTSSVLNGSVSYEQVLSSGNHYTSSDLQDAINYNENNTTYTRNRH